MDNVGPVSVTPAQVAHLVSRGVKTGEIIRLLVATGTWSDSGAAEIVSTIAKQPDDTKPPPIRADLQWPGPPDDPPPLFADSGTQGREFSGDSDALTIFATPAAPDQGRH